MGATFGSLMTFMQMHGLMPSGPPRAIYTAFDPEGTVFTVAFPIAEPPEGTTGSRHCNYCPSSRRKNPAIHSSRPLPQLEYHLLPDHPIHGGEGPDNRRETRLGKVHAHVGRVRERSFSNPGSRPADLHSRTVAISPHSKTPQDKVSIILMRHSGANGNPEKLPAYRLSPV